MPNTKIFTAKNVQQYGFTDREIDELNAEWDRKASELGLEEHLPEYWQEAKHHMSEKLEGWVAESREEISIKHQVEEPIELPSLDVSLGDFDTLDEDEISTVALLDDETVVEDVPEELPVLESISVDDLDLEVLPEGQGISVEERAVEKEPAEEEAVEEFAAAAEQGLEMKEADQEQILPDEERAAEEENVPVGAPDLPDQDTALTLETAAKESESEVNTEEEIAPVKENKKESFFGKIFARLKKIF